LGADPNKAVREIVSRLFEPGEGAPSPAQLKIAEDTPLGQGVPPAPDVSEGRTAIAPDWTTTGEPRRFARSPEELAAILAGQGETPESVANAFARAYGQPGPAVEARTQASNLPALDADSLRLIEQHMGVPPDQVRALGPNSQRRLLSAAMEA